MALVQMLVQAGAALNQADSDDTTALMFAAAQGHGDIVDMLLAGGADPDRQDAEGLTALAWARARGQDAVTRILALRAAKSTTATVSSTSGAVPTVLPQDSRAALIKAIERNDALSLMRLLDQLPNAGTNVEAELDGLWTLQD